jgi:hypothetical protein
MYHYRVAPDWTKVRDSDFLEGKALLDVLADARVFCISKAENSEGWCLREGCDDHFNVVLTPQQLYNLGAELQALAMTSGRSRSDLEVATSSATVCN